MSRFIIDPFNIGLFFDGTFYLRTHTGVKEECLSKAVPCPVAGRTKLFPTLLLVSVKLLSVLRVAAMLLPLGKQTPAKRCHWRNQSCRPAYRRCRRRNHNCAGFFNRQRYAIHSLVISCVGSSGSGPSVASVNGRSGERARKSSMTVLSSASIFSLISDMERIRSR